MQKISNATIKKIPPKISKLSKFTTVFYVHNGELIEKLRWSYYLLLLLSLPLIMLLQILSIIYEALSELTAADFGRTKQTYEISNTHLKTLLKG